MQVHVSGMLTLVSKSLKYYFHSGNQSNRYVKKDSVSKGFGSHATCPHSPVITNTKLGHTIIKLQWKNEKIRPIHISIYPQRETIQSQRKKQLLLQTDSNLKYTGYNNWWHVAEIQLKPKNINIILNFITWHLAFRFISPFGGKPGSRSRASCRAGPICNRTAPLVIRYEHGR